MSPEAWRVERAVPCGSESGDKNVICVHGWGRRWRLCVGQEHEMRSLPFTGREVGRPLLSPRSS